MGLYLSFKKFINARMHIMKQFHHSIWDRGFCLKCSSDTANNEKYTMQSDIIVKKKNEFFFWPFCRFKRCKGSAEFYRFFFEEIKPYYLSSYRSKVKKLWDFNDYNSSFKRSISNSLFIQKCHGYELGNKHANKHEDIVNGCVFCWWKRYLTSVLHAHLKRPSNWSVKSLLQGWKYPVYNSLLIKYTDYAQLIHFPLKLFPSTVHSILLLND